MDCSAEDSGALWLWSHSVFVAVVSSAAVDAVAALLCIPMPAAAMLVDVMSSVPPSIIDEALLDRRCFPTSRGWFLMDRYFSLVSGCLDAFFCSRPSTLRGRALGLLSCRHMEQSLHLVSNVPCLGIRRLKHVTQQHGRCHNILSCSREVANERLWLLISDNLSVHLLSTTTRASAVRVRLVLLEVPLELGEAFAVLVELGLELPQLCELCSFVVLWWRVDLSVVPRCPGVFSCYGGSATGGGILRVVSSCYLAVDVEALTRRVVAVRFGVGIWFSGVETSAAC